MKIVFLHLSAFKSVGGIQNFNKSFIKALSDIRINNNLEIYCISLHDSLPDNKYLEGINFTGCDGWKIKFLIHSLIKSYNADKVIIGHINLALVLLLIKFLLFRYLILIVHGIEVWSRLSYIKKLSLKKTDTILSVSEFTKNKILEHNQLDFGKIIIFPNTVDPFFKFPSNFEKPEFLKSKLSIRENDKVLLTVSRLSSQEMYKGYDKVIEILPDIIEEIPNIKYLIVGKGDTAEIDRINDLINELRLEDNVYLLGYVPNDQLVQYYLLCDLFILPSKCEGFGIVLLEAMICGKSIIAGNADASKDLVENTGYGILVDPEDNEDIKEKIIEYFESSGSNMKIDPLQIQRRCIELYCFEKFKENLSIIILNKFFKYE